VSSTLVEVEETVVVKSVTDVALTSRLLLLSVMSVTSSPTAIFFLISHPRLAANRFSSRISVPPLPSLLLLVLVMMMVAMPSLLVRVPLLRRLLLLVLTRPHLLILLLSHDVL